MINRAYIFVFLFLLWSCEKDEIPVPAHISGDVTANSVEVGEKYTNQVFFSLDQNAVISSNLKTDWDLAFECADTGWHVRLNTAKGMAGAYSNESFADLTDTTGLVWKWDAHSGHADSTAIGDWYGAAGTFAIDNGFSENGDHLGFSKLRILSVTNSQYEIEYGNLSTTTASIAIVPKNSAYGYTYFNILSGGLVDVAPPATNWDILFTQYTHIFDGPTPYLVTGVLINPFNTRVAIVTDKAFDDVSYVDVQAKTYSTDLNAIGYLWKFFNFDAGLYEVDASLIFIIKTQSGYYYKFHFIDFYNESGVKGYPKFEFTRL